MTQKTKEENIILYKMTEDINNNTTEEDSLLLLLRDAIVQHSPLNDIKLILRYFLPIILIRIIILVYVFFLLVVNM
jgi:hypothetical protein